MFKFITGDILESEADCLINTVNCEGFMGKGIAYQFKLKFPECNKSYVKACKNGSLYIGSLHYFTEKNKTIINFPTKNKWREKSSLNYITTGLSELKKLLPILNIKSIAIPPLGCGNGGLSWVDVKPLILEYLNEFKDQLDISIFEPSQYFRPSGATQVPNLNLSHLIIMSYKPLLNRFNKIRIQKAAYFLNLFMGVAYFKFEKYKLGPYAHSIDILIKDINEFQTHYNVKNNEAIELAKKILTSKEINKKMKEFNKYIIKSANFVNSIKTDLELELYATICFIVEKRSNVSREEIISEIKAWSKEKSEKFTEESIYKAIEVLFKENLIEKDLVGLYTMDKISNWDLRM